MEFSRCARARDEPTCRDHRCEPVTSSRPTDLSKLNSALADRLTEVMMIRVGDEVDIHLGEL